MSNIYSAIANVGSNAGAGLNAYAQNKYALEADQERRAQNAYVMDMERKAQREKERQAQFDEAAMILAGGGSEDDAIRYLDAIEPVRDRAVVIAGLRGRMAQIGGQPKVGLTPVYGTDEQGNTVLMQTTSDGRILRPELPPGIAVSRPISFQRLGDNVTGFDPMTGRPVMSAPMGLPPQDTPEVRAAQQSAVEEAKTQAIPSRSAAEIDAELNRRAAEVAQQATFDLPQAITNAESAISVLSALKEHPGLDYLVGAAAVLPVVPGTPQADANAYLEQVQGKAFLEAFATLKGGGQITEIEGAKATAAMARLSRAQSKAAFQQALDELIGIAESGMQRAQKKAAPSVDGESSPAVEQKSDEAVNWSDL